MRLTYALPAISCHISTRHQNLLLGAALIPFWSDIFGGSPTIAGQRHGITATAVTFYILANLGQLQFVLLIWYFWGTVFIPIRTQ
jgi:hypothetical protein